MAAGTDTGEVWIGCPLGEAEALSLAEGELHGFRFLGTATNIEIEIEPDPDGQRR